MAVYTRLTTAELGQFLQAFALGELTQASDINGGVENTNYRLVTTHGRYVLTLFEHHQPAEVQDFVRLARHLNNAGFLVPAPLADQHGNWLHSLAGKPAILCELLPGDHIEDASPRQCWEIGEALARLHLASKVLEQPRPNSRGFDWWQRIYSEATRWLEPADYRLLSSEMAWQMSNRVRWKALPRGWIHGDLFRDNVLFVEQQGKQRIGAVLDWYNACEGVWIYDLAIIANDWCCDVTGEWEIAKYDALLAGYQSVRPFTIMEQQSWQMVLRGAATRFWLSRLETLRHQESIEGMTGNRKDPNEYRDKLRTRQQQYQPAPKVLV
ncbi:homoserine kinase [Oceanobacter mangrovi]|uniref:homoserine kinase n=1 Tax=Oceanobacter mangrovi TaxID=2862510 RepID=UPI001C8D35C1|nr:homoserine kinase [Oceanobacter mangrovi]